MSEIIESPEREERRDLTPMEMLDRAVTSGASPEALESLLTLEKDGKRDRPERHLFATWLWRGASSSRCLKANPVIIIDIDMKRCQPSLMLFAQL